MDSPCEVVLSCEGIILLYSVLGSRRGSGVARREMSLVDRGVLAWPSSERQLCESVLLCWSRRGDESMFYLSRDVTHAKCWCCL